MKINVIKKAVNTKVVAHVCPWVMDVPPESQQK